MTTPFLKRPVFDVKDMTYRFEDGSAPIPYEFRVDTGIMTAHQEASRNDNGVAMEPMLFQWLGRLWKLKDHLKGVDPNWDKCPNPHQP